MRLVILTLLSYYVVVRNKSKGLADLQYLLVEELLWLAAACIFAAPCHPRSRCGRQGGTINQGRLASPIPMQVQA